MDASAMVMGEVRLAPLRDTVVWQLWRHAQDRLQDGTDWVELGLVERVVFSGTEEAGAAPSFIVALDGTFGEGYLESRVNDGPPPEQRGPLAFYRLGELYWAQVYPELLLGCTEDRLEQVASSWADSAAARAKDSALYRSMVERLKPNDATIVLLVDGEDPARRKLLGRTARQNGVDVGDGVRRAGVAITMGPQIGLRGLAELESAGEAQRLQTQLAASIDAASSNLLLAVFGLRPLLSALQVTSLENFVQLSAELPREDLFAILGKLKNLVELGGAARAQGGAGAAAP